MINGNGNHQPMSSRAALRRVLIVLAIVAGAAIYSYGWMVTDVDLNKPQEGQRQQNVSRALQELLAPTLFVQDRERVDLSANFRYGCTNEPVEPVPHDASGAYITLTPDCGEAGDIITVQVYAGTPNADSRLRWVPPDGQSRPLDVQELGREEFVLDANGDFTGTIEVPMIRGADGQIHQVDVRSLLPSGPVQPSPILEQVLLRMVETIFMALLATSVAIPIAAVISFFAARNLMRPLKLLTGSMLVAFIFLAIGLGLGQMLLTPVGSFAVATGSGGEVPLLAFLSTGDSVGALAAFVVPIVILALLIALLRYVRSVQTRMAPEPVKLEGKRKVDTLVVITPAARAVGIMNTLLLTVTIVFAVGVVGGWLILLGGQLKIFGNTLRPEFLQLTQVSSETPVPLAPLEWIQNAFADAVVGVGTLADIVGTVVELLMPLVGAIVGGFTLASIASGLLSAPLRRVGPVLNRVFGALLGLIAGAILLAFTAQIGLTAALFGLLTPIIAAILGGQILAMIFRRVTGVESKAVYESSRLNDLLGTGAFAIGAVATFVVMLNVLNVGRALIDGTLPSQAPINILGIEMIEYTLKAAIAGGILGGVAGLFSGVHSNFPIGSALYNVSRTVLNTIRSIEPLIMGLVFVIWVGIGPFAGVLALTLHSVAALGKLYSEQIENIDPGPIEAIQSTGANQLQTIIYAVVPQIVPPYIAFTMYRWDINVRMSTIIGFVGGGGIGLLLYQQINLLQYHDAGVSVLAIAIVVSVLDYASASIRERLV